MAKHMISVVKANKLIITIVIMGHKKFVVKARHIINIDY